MGRNLKFQMLNSRPEFQPSSKASHRTSRPLAPPPKHQTNMTSPSSLCRYVHWSVKCQYESVAASAVHQACASRSTRVKRSCPEAQGSAAEQHQALGPTAEARSRRRRWPDGRPGKANQVPLHKGRASWTTMLGYRCTGLLLSIDIVL